MKGVINPVNVIFWIIYWRQINCVIKALSQTLSERCFCLKVSGLSCWAVDRRNSKILAEKKGRVEPLK